MNLTLIGYGKMGKEIHKLAPTLGHTVVSIIDPNLKEATHPKKKKNSIAQTDVAIDFSNSESVLENCEKLASSKINIVVGTTGWLSEIESLRAIVEKKKIGLIYAANFSIGVNLFWKILKKACQLINEFPEYDVFGHEFHHKGKVDSPSGSALSCAAIILNHLDRKKVLITEKLDRKINPEELHFSSTRGGSVPGTHSIFFDSDYDTIELTHTARGRQGFALGALKCAEFIKGKKGLYTIEDYFKKSHNH